MKNRKVILLALALLWSLAASAQQQKPQPLTFWYDYSVKPGKEDEFMNLVKAIGEPVRDKLMADGVILAWGIDVPLLRAPGGHNRIIWYAVMDWSGIEKVDSAMRAQLAKIAADEAKSPESGKKGQKPGMTTAQRVAEVFDASKTRDWLTRDIVFAVGNTMPPAGFLPYTRYNYTKVKPGKAGAYRETWEKYNQPVLDKLVADGVILAYGLSVEELRTEGDFTHYTWYSVKGLDGFDKVRDAFNADRDRRSKEEREAITGAFLAAIDPDASRSEVARSIVFKLPAPKK
jgi:hypothetical protein